MLGVLVWIVVILLICFSVTGWHWIIFYVVILPFSTLLFFFYVDFPENRFNIKRFKNDIKYLLNKLKKINGVSYNLDYTNQTEKEKLDKKFLTSLIVDF